MHQGTVSRRVKLGSVIAVPIAAAVIGLAAVAFACVPQGSISLSPSSGAVGTNVTVTGSNFTSGTDVKVWFGGVGKQQVGSAVTRADRTWTMTFQVPASANGRTVVSATQADANGAVGSPANALFNVTTPGGVAPTPAPNVQQEPANADGAAALAPAVDPAPEAAPAATPTPAPAAAPATAAAPRVRVAPAQPTTRTAAAPVAAPAAPAPAPVATPAPEATPAPAVTPAPVTPAPADSAPVTAPARRSVMVSMADDSDGSPALAIALVGIGLVLALGASALVLAGRRDRKAPARANR